MTIIKNNIKPFVHKLIPLFFGMISLFILLVVADFSPNCFFCDDNSNQWGPIIEQAYNTFFTQGYMPYIDFYQYKGFEIMSQGYYGINNPFMCISYLISKYIFSSKIQTLVVYIFLMYFCGSICMYLLLQQFSLKSNTIYVTTFIYICCSAYIIFSHYYFTSNNYFFIPFFLLVLLKTHNKKESYFVPGFILAFSLLLGHVQYTFYYMIAFCLYYLFWTVYSKKGCYIIKLFTNVLIFSMLSCPQIILLLKAGMTRSTKYPTIDSDFLSLPIAFHSLFKVTNPPIINYGISFNDFCSYYANNAMGIGVMGILMLTAFLSLFNHILQWLFDNLRGRLKKRPQYSVQFLSRLLQKFSQIEIMYLKHLGITLFLLFAVLYLFWFNTFMLIMGEVLVVIFSVISLFVKNNYLIRIYYFLKKYACKWKWYLISIPLIYRFPVLFFLVLGIWGLIKLYKNSYMDKGMESHLYAYMFICIFFVLFSMGTESPIAIILSKLPLIGSFRFLYKCIFIFIPFIIIIGAYQMDRSALFQKPLYILSLVLCIITLSNTHFILNSGVHNCINNNKYTEVPAQCMEDIKKIIFSNKIDTQNYRILACSNENKQMDLIEKATSECWSKICRNTGTINKVFTIGGYDSVFSDTSYLQSDAIYSDILIEYLYTDEICQYNIFSENIKEDNIQKFQTQIQENAIKYIIFTKNNSNLINSFLELIDRCPELSLGSSYNGIGDTIIYELESVPALCHEKDTNIVIPLSTEMGRIYIKEPFRKRTDLIFSFTYDPNYRICYTDKYGKVHYIIPKANDHNYITATIPENAYKAYLYYKNNVMDMVLIFGLIITICTVIFSYEVFKNCVRNDICEF